MKKLLVLAVLAAVAAAAVPTFAGDCGMGGGSESGGFSCSNPCPCAQAANAMRSSGRESIAVSASIRAIVAASVQRNLARV